MINRDMEIVKDQDDLIWNRVFRESPSAPYKMANDVWVEVDNFLPRRMQLIILEEFFVNTVV